MKLIRYLFLFVLMLFLLFLWKFLTIKPEVETVPQTKVTWTTAPTPVPAVAKAPVKPSGCVDITIDSNRILELINQNRIDAGLRPLNRNSLLDISAQMKTNDLIEKDYWSHISPDGVTPWQFFLASGYDYEYAGENLARWFCTPEDTVIDWMKSPTHKANIINPVYEEIGIGVHYTYVTTHFGKLK